MIAYRSQYKEISKTIKDMKDFISYSQVHNTSVPFGTSAILKSVRDHARLLNVARGLARGKKYEEIESNPKKPLVITDMKTGRMVMSSKLYKLFMQVSYEWKALKEKYLNKMVEE